MPNSHPLGALLSVDPMYNTALDVVFLVVVLVRKYVVVVAVLSVVEAVVSLVFVLQLLVCFGFVPEEVVVVAVVAVAVAVVIVLSLVQPSPSEQQGTPWVEQVHQVQESLGRWAAVELQAGQLEVEIEEVEVGGCVQKVAQQAVRQTGRGALQWIEKQRREPREAWNASEGIFFYRQSQSSTKLMLLMLPLKMVLMLTTIKNGRPLLAQEKHDVQLVLLSLLVSLEQLVLSMMTMLSM